VAPRKIASSKPTTPTRNGGRWHATVVMTGGEPIGVAPCKIACAKPKTSTLNEGRWHVGMVVAGGGPISRAIFEHGGQAPRIGGKRARLFEHLDSREAGPCELRARSDSGWLDAESPKGTVIG
jgi:hypothetical protein